MRSNGAFLNDLLGYAGNWIKLANAPVVQNLLLKSVRTHVRSMLVLFFLLMGFTSMGNDIHIRVIPVIGGQEIKIGIPVLLNNDTIRISQLRFYLSEITFMDGGDTVWQEPQGYRLMSLADTNSLGFLSYLPDEFVFNAIRFRLGVDSVSSSTGAHTGALDPANGMYWAWHTGYVNLKMEGVCSGCPPPNKKFEFHIGGFQHPFNAERVITLETGEKEIVVFFDVGRLLYAAFSNKHFTIMTPGPKAMQLAGEASQSFRLK